MGKVPQYHDTSEQGRFILKAYQNGDIIVGEDGFKVFWPDGRKGAFNAQQLRWVAEALDNYNDWWGEQVAKDLAALDKNPKN